MPIKKICPRCNAFIDARLKYCEPCQARVTKDNNKQYDKTKRNKQSTMFYRSSEWLDIRQTIIAKAKGIDLYAYIVHKRIVKADTVHHIIELSEAWSKRLDVDNLIAISESSHREIHKIYNRGGKDKANMVALLKRIISSEYYTNIKSE